jgi:hypothetical protein
LVLGIGGGGDVVGGLAIGRLCESLGTPFELGGVAWERFAVDPYPGPRPIEQIRGGRRIGDAAVLADPDTGTKDGLRFGESRMAGFLSRRTVLIDVTGGPAAVADGVVAAAEELDCDLVVYVDVGGDVLAHGQEPHLASPLCDAVLLAAAVRAADRVRPLGAVFGPGCDGELSVPEVLDRIAGLAADGGWLGAWALPAEIADELERAASEVPTEASLQAVRCARGETGRVAIRDGRLHVELGPIGALTLFFDPVIAMAGEARLARAVADAPSLDAARDILDALGVRSELEYERRRRADGVDPNRRNL